MKKNSTWIMALAFLLSAAGGRAGTPKVGDKAPDFELPGHRGGERFRLSDARDKKNVVLVFYPLDWTPV